MNVLIIGAGAWGTTLATLVVRAENQATLFSRSVEVYLSLSVRRQHPVSLQGFVLPDAVNVTNAWPDAISAIPDLIMIAVPSKGIDQVAGMLATARYDGAVVTATKGIDPLTLTTASTRIAVHVGDAVRIAALSGPNLASEIAKGLPAAAVVASAIPETAKLVQRALMSPAFRIYTSTDVAGVELAGALKNVISIGAGIGDGLSSGHNAKAAFITRGIAEMTRLGVASGADPMTFAGLAGIGDLLATCGSRLSRNHTVGRRLAGGETLEHILASMSEVAEGVPTTKAAVALGRRHGVELPISTQIYEILFNSRSPNEAVLELMSREPTGEVG